MTKELDAAGFQRKCSDFVQREVICCLSGIVATVAQAYGHTRGTGQLDSLNELADEANELFASLDDYEEAAIQAGWSFSQTARVWSHPERNNTHATEENLCHDEGIEPYQREVFEHWAVSNYLAEKLTAHGEKVGDFDSFKVWARTTTGQAISIDGVIETIVREMMDARA